MTFYVYMLKSMSKHPVTYVGYTNNLKKRLQDHNKSKGAKFTRGRKWKIIYKETYSNKSQAMKAEYLLKKNYNLRKEIKKNFIKNDS